MAKIQTFELMGRVRTSVPDVAIDQGDAWRAMANVGGHFSQRLGKLADQAAAREGELAGLTAGQMAGVSFTAMEAAQGAANTRAGVKPTGYDLTPHLTDPSRAPHLAGIKPEFRDRLGNLVANAPEELRGQIQLLSGFRSNERQAELYEAALAKYGSPEAARKWVAPPGNSRHNHGDAYDLRYGSDAAREWVHANAAQYGLSFPMAHEPWHIEMVEARGGAAPTPAAQAAQDQAFGQLQPAEGATVLETTPLALRRDGTIRGEAFDAAAMRAYGWRMEAGLTSQLNAAFDEFSDNPAAYQARVGEIRQTFFDEMTMGGDPELVERFDQTFITRTQAASRQVMANQEAKLRAEETAAFGEAMDSFSRDLERQAYSLGLDPNAEPILESQVAHIGATIEGAIAAGTITPAQGAQFRSQLGTTLANARITGVFEALETPVQKEQFALGLLDDWAAGEGPLAEMSFAQVKALSHTLYSQARSQTNQLNAAQRVEASTLEALIADDIASIGATGVGLDRTSGLDPSRVEALLGPEKMAAWQSSRELAQRGWEATAGMDIETPAEMDQRLEALLPQEGQAGFVEQAALYAEAARRKDDILKARAVDPLGQAHAGGMVELAPIDGSSGEALAQSLAQRATQARAVAGAWGTPVTVFRPGERQALADALTASPDMLPGFALSVTQAFGDLAPVALAELSEAGPVLAHAAGITLATGDNSVAADIARTLDARNQGQFRVTMPSDSKFTAAAAPVMGSAFAALPGTQASTISTAMLLFEREANLSSFNAADVDTAGSAANAAWLRAVDRALGATTMQGVKYGGVAEINGQQTFIPPDLPAEAVSRALSLFADDDLAALGVAPTGINGVPLTASQLRRARLVAVGQDTYRMALGDPLGVDPQYVLGTDGNPFVLDIGDLIYSQNERGATQGANYTDWTGGLVWQP